VFDLVLSCRYVKYIIADLASVNRYGGTALIPAAHHGHPDVIRFLLTTEIDVDHVNDLGWTALLEAVILGDGSPLYQEIVTLLLEGGADPSIADRDGVNPLAHARARGQEAVAKLLEAAEGKGE
jgi:ankyrin repeat protein